MGDGGINIRVLWFHFMLTKQYKPSVSFNRYTWKNGLDGDWFKVHEWKMD